MQVSTGSSQNILPTTTSTSDERAGSTTTEEASVNLQLEEKETSGQKNPPTRFPTLKAFWQRWYPAIRGILPIYIAVHLAILALDCLAILFVNKDFSPILMPISTLWRQWHFWDAAILMHIAQNGYQSPIHLAFFPLYPLLERAVWTFAGDPFLAGLIVSNVAEFVMFTALYRLVSEEFDGNRAYMTVLYFALFPTAFYFSAAYTESVFLCFSILSFYHMRNGRWWWMALFGCLASLTRPDGMYLIAPFCYEYFRRIWQRQGDQPPSIFSREQIVRLIKGIRFDILIGICLAGGVIAMIAFGTIHNHDPLAFIHAHRAWSRNLGIPFSAIVRSMTAIYRSGFLSFLGLRTSIDVGLDLLIGACVLLSFIGPWKLPKTLWSFGIYAATLYVYFHLFPKGGGNPPLESMSRFLLELFPAFIILARISKFRTLHLSYCMLSGALLFFLLIQYLTGHWVL